MATQTARRPPLETIRTLPQQGSESPQPKAYPKWHPLTRLSTETITEFRSDIDSTNWRHTTATTFYLYLGYIWAAVLVFMCIYIPLMSLDYDDSGDHCAPDGSFRLEPSNILALTWFFQVVLGFGSLNFTAVKAIDVVWDVVSDFDNIKSLRKLLTLKKVVGRAGQTLLAYISWRIFSKCLYSVIITDPVTYQTFWTVFMQDGPSLWSTIHTFRDFAWRRGLRSKPTMVFMILTMIFVLAFPTLASAMTGYSANNQAVVKTDDVKQVLFSQFKSARLVIHDGNRVNLSVNYACNSDYGPECMACSLPGCIANYIFEYGVSGHGKSKWNGTDLDSPTLNITSYSDQQSRRPFVFENKLYEYEYFNDWTICQPIMENNQQTYQWGFSVLQLEITLCLLTLWIIGIYIMWATAHLRLESMGISYKAPGDFKSTIILADAIHKDFKEQQCKDVNSLTGRELMSYIETRLNGGRVMVQAPPLIPRQSAWKLIRKWVMENKAWTFAFAVVSLSMIYYPVASLMWLTMTFSIVAGWGQNTRELVFLLSLVSGGLIPAGYLVLIFLRKRFKFVFGGPVKGTSQAG